MSFFFIAIGLFTIILTLAKPAFYWDSRKAKRMRRFLGDGLTSVIYLLIGGAVTIIGILEIMGVIHLQ